MLGFSADDTGEIDYNESINSVGERSATAVQ